MVSKAIDVCDVFKHKDFALNIVRLSYKVASRPVASGSRETVPIWTIQSANLCYRVLSLVRRPGFRTYARVIQMQANCFVGGWLQLYRKAGISAEGFTGVPVFQAEGLTVKTGTAEYTPLFLNKADLDAAISTADAQKYGPCHPLIVKRVQEVAICLTIVLESGCLLLLLLLALMTLMLLLFLALNVLLLVRLYVTTDKETLVGAHVFVQMSALVVCLVILGIIIRHHN
jgi:hypothetical protein